MLSSRCVYTATAMLLIAGSAITAEAAELLDGTWTLNVSGNSATGNDWEIFGGTISGPITAFSGVRRSADSSYFIGGIGLGPVIIGTNASNTPAGNRTGFLYGFVNANGTIISNGRWTDSSGSFPLSGSFLAP